jgi:GT2 family glycosyltransferase
MAVAMTVVVVPVFNAASETRRCLDSLQRNLTATQPVIVIDDASTDPAITELMTDLPESWVQVKNRSNQGFVASANLGISLAAGEDVILLNSDTQVTSGWLEAIETCAASNARIASVTPLTNHGEIAAIPEFCRSNPWPDDPERWARACRESGPAQYPVVPTAVGFCMWMRRELIDQIGTFDEQAFGRGYGEENDWSMRAIKVGWHHVLCDHAFVAHQGHASFGPLGLAPGGQAMQTLLERHPNYLEQVQAFIQTDPMAERRQIITRYHESITP